MTMVRSNPCVIRIRRSRLGALSAVAQQSMTRHGPNVVASKLSVIHSEEH